MSPFDTAFPPTQAGLDVVVSIAFAVSINVLLHTVTPAYAGPLTAVAMLIAVSAILRLRGQRWSDLGLARRHGPLALTGLVLLVMVGSILTGGITSGICATLMEASSADRVARFGEVEGNLARFLALVAMGWAVGGFIEEMVFRGFFLHRFETLFAACTSRAWLATSLAVVAQASLFGAVHYYNRGLAGGLTITVVGMTLAAFYLLAKRSLWPTILAHGLIDTLGFLEDYLGV